MNSTKIYLDNAATTHPKPEEVYLAADRVFRQGGSPGRSAHELALLASRQVFECRVKLAQFLKVKNPERLVFTPGCTYGINMVLQRFPFAQGDLVLVSALEHNAVMRCLDHLRREKGIIVEQVPYKEGTILDPQLLKSLLEQKKPRLCAFLEASNVTGEMLDLRSVATICHQAQVPLLVDAAQSAGAFHESLDLEGISFWSAPAHKGLYGMAGLGILYVSPLASLDPLISGGTGSFSEGLDMPPAFPDRLEPGTLSAVAIAALSAGVDFVSAKGRDYLAEHERILCSSLIDFLSAFSRIKYYAKIERRVGLLSFFVDGLDSGYVAQVLDQQYGICVRAGLHCAASAHRTLGTLNGGLVRVSFSAFNTKEELNILFNALEQIVEASK